MNFLAHLYLSGDDEGLMTGNMLADFRKGTKHIDFPERVQSGICLHQAIDEFTDAHPLVEHTKQLLRPQFHHFSPVIADVFYDHFLAREWADYSDVSLKEFSKKCYRVLTDNREFFPARLKRFLFFMRLENLFVSYGSIKGINRVLYGMSTRTRYGQCLQFAADELSRNYDLYRSDFTQFMKDVIPFAEEERAKLS
ncbi:MAG: DUF479 domain-containing protein [Bacteroidetes bacterium]|nr:DUF479 domain-containing protein [Bacteroidota bacterium]MBU1717546.1 DUF479 domain-containing protein [Bacteroidota bacterium]